MKNVILVTLVLAALTSNGAAQQASVSERYVMQDVMIPTRDGTRLHTRVLTPRAQSGPLPFIMERTPYGIGSALQRLNGQFGELAEDNYIFVFQDIRGRYGSEGQFVMMRPARNPGDSKAIDEGTDTWDTIEWLLKNVPNNNGRVGMMGVSYPGWTTIMGALEPHPALKAISPQASPSDMWLGDDFHHNGAFRLSYGFEYAAMMETSKEQEQFKFDKYDTFDWYLALGPLANVNDKYLKGKIPTWNDYVAHPDYDAFWQRQTLIPFIKSATVPTLNVAGWWDQEDFYGPIDIYSALEKHDRNNLNYLVVGPWNHGGWSRGTGDRLGDIQFGSPTAQYYREQVQKPWFAYWLKDQGKLDLPEALTFEVGTNTWKRWETWPPKSVVQSRNLYFHSNGKLSFDAPKTSARDSLDAYVSDPAHPVPYRARPIPPTYFPGGSGWPTWLVTDQRFVDDRPDVLSWETEVLQEDVTIAGEVLAKLFASTTGSDADFIMKLIDVYPEEGNTEAKMNGWQLMVSNEVFRGRYREGYTRSVPIKPDSVLPFSWSLHTQNYTFKKGHRIMVQVQSTWFPLVDRNPQTFVPNIFNARASDFRAATMRVHRNSRYPSSIVIPVIMKPST
jgi:uncharacterized protein